jgi:signal transduction histidine kinase
MTGSDRKPGRVIQFENGRTATLSGLGGPSDSATELSTWSRLHHLYTVTRLLVNFESVDRTLDGILATVSGTLPLLTAVLIDETTGRARTSVWNTKGVSDQKLRAARNHATATYAYLAGSGSASDTTAGQEDNQPLDPSRIVSIPLVVDRRPIFGVLQLECAASFTEPDLIFVNAVANQLAVALDRHKAMQQEVAAHAEAEAAGRRMRFLADASRLLAVSLDYRSTWENMARLAVPEIADYCFIDILEGPSLRRTAVLSPDLPPEVREKLGEGMLAGVVSDVLKTGRSLIHPQVSGELATGPKEEDSDGSFESYMCVPLRIKGNTLGTLTLVSARSGRVFNLNDLLLLKDLALRTVVAFENAQLYADALQAIRGRDDVVSAVAHDLKGPLAMVLRNVEMLFTKAASEESLICDRKHVEGIKELAGQMNTLIDDLLDIARIEARHLHVGREDCQVLPLINEVMDLANPLAFSKAIRLTSELPPDLPSLFVDRHRILQVFANLIGNAVKFTPPGGTITVRAERFADDVQFSVQDTGTGIPAEEIPHVFDRFWQAKSTSHLGTGLGLFIVKGIVESHEGFIWIESEPGVGSKFLFTVPLKNNVRAAD